MNTPNRLLSEIRNYTQTCHTELEAKLDLLNRVRVVDDYQKLLLKLYGFYAPLEEALGKWKPEFEGLGLAFEMREKTSLLLNDLDHFKLGKGLPADLPLPKTFAQAVGCLYVLEGSTLGAQFICRHLKSLFKENDTSLSFYQGYGSSTGKMWQEFCEFLGRYSNQLKSESEFLEVSSSAKQTFQIFGEWVC